jgi:predicted dehydrogenase
MASQRKLNVGMIGAGFIGQLAHMMNLKEIASCNLLALAEFRPELRSRVATRFEIPRAYSTHVQLLNDADIEAVVVVTPRPQTGPVVLDCLRAGKHVLSEKPMAGTVEQAQKLVAEAKARNRLYAVGYMKRYDEGVQLAKSMLQGLMQSGELGPVLFARAHCYMGDSYCRADGHVVTEERVTYADGGWPIAPADFPEASVRDYAAALNTYSHNTNLLRFLFGKTPTVEYANFARPHGGIAVLGFGDFQATLEIGRTSNRGWDEVTEVYFADGKLTLRTPPALLKNVPAQLELYRGGSIQETRTFHCEWTWAFRRQVQAFVSDALEGRPSISSGEDAIEDVKLFETMWRKHLG